MKRSALIGDPVEHSLSPVMHNAAFRAMGIDAIYELWPTVTADLPARFASIRAPDILGANITVPHKQAVMEFCDGLTDTARRIGAVNTLIPQSNGTIIGDNTDAYGFARTLDAAMSGSSPGRALIIGAGGAARAVAVALVDSGVASVTIANRTRQRADSLVETLRDAGVDGIEAIAWDELADAVPEVGLVVNATSIGWHSNETPVSPEVIAALDPDGAVIDLTYRDTALLRMVRKRHITGIDGLSMLIHQGVRALELWTGLQPPVAVMTEAVMREQARRSTA
jgi:shikimate dehydrogenase